MRFYLKLLAAVAIFVCGLGLPARETIADLAFDLRVAYVSRCGSAEQFEKLLDDTQKSLAAQRGETECYELGKRYQRLLSERLAEARDSHVSVSDELRQAIENDCAREAYGSAWWVQKRDQAHRDELATLAPHAHEFSIQLD